MVAARVAAWSTSSRLEPVLAWTAPITAPSTSGPSEMRTRSRYSSPTSSSIAMRAESTAEPRSTRTSAPSPESAASIAAAILVAEVPISPPSAPPAASTRTSSAICPASSTTPSATLAECDTITRPTVIGRSPRRRGPPRSGGWRWRRGPGGRGSARPGSWPGPCAPPAGWWPRRPCGHRPRPRPMRCQAPCHRPGPRRAPRGRDGAHRSWSCPRAGPCPARPRRRALPAGRRRGRRRPPRPGRRGCVPWPGRTSRNGPEAPPTLPISAMLTALSTAPMVGSAGRASRRSMTVRKPRAMLVPWSPSPMAASSLVSSVACSSITAAVRRTQATACSVENMGRAPFFGRQLSSAHRGGLVDPFCGHRGGPVGPSLAATALPRSEERGSDRASAGVPSAHHSGRWPSDAPAEAGGQDRGVPQAQLLAVGAQQGDGAALHLQGGDEGADQAAGDLHATLVEELGQAAVDHVQLGEGRATHGVDERDHLLALVEAEVLDHRAGEPVGELVGRLHADALAAGLAVDADADLDLVVAQLEGGRPRGRDGAGGQRQAHGADVRDHVAGQLDHGLEVAALLRLGPRQLLQQHGAADAPASLGVERVAHGHVVVDHDALDLAARLAGELGGHLEVHDVAGVVLDDVQHSSAAVHLPGGPLHLVRGRRGEHLARAGGVQHAPADEAPVHRLVARAAAGYQGDLPLPRSIRPVHARRVVVHPHQVGVRPRDPLEGLPHELVDLVDQLLHASPPWYPSTTCRRPSSSSRSRTSTRGRRPCVVGSCGCGGGPVGPRWFAPKRSGRCGRGPAGPWCVSVGLVEPAAGALDGFFPFGVAVFALVVGPGGFEDAVDLPVVAHLVQA